VVVMVQALARFRRASMGFLWPRRVGSPCQATTQLSLETPIPSR